MSAYIRAGVVSGTECRRRSKGRGRRSEQRERGPFRALKMRPVRQEAVHSLWSRLFCGPLKMRRVPQEAFLSTARIFRTIGGPLRYRMPDTQRQVASSHMACRVLVGNLYKEVKDPNLIAKISGHVENSRAFSRYRDIDEEMTKEVILKLE